MSVFATTVLAKQFACDALPCAARSPTALSQEEARRIARESGWAISDAEPIKDYCPKHAHLRTRRPMKAGEEF